MSKIKFADFLDDDSHDDYVRMAENLVSRSEALRGGRLLRIAIVQQQFNEGNLTEQQARELLKANLTPNDDSTFVDDSDQLVMEMT